MESCRLCGATENDIESDHALLDNLVALCIAKKEYDETNRMEQADFIIVPMDDWKYARMIAFARKLVDKTGGEFDIVVNTSITSDENRQYLKITWVLEWCKCSAREKKRKLVSSSLHT